MGHVKHPRRHQLGHTLVQTLVGMALSMWVISAAMAAFAWVQASHRLLQAHADAQGRLGAGLQSLRQRVQRASAPELVFDSKGKAGYERISNGLQGSDSALTLVHARSLTPADCQGHQASDWIWLADDFMLNTRQELVCKDNWRDNSSYQALVDGVGAVQFLYAQLLPGNSPQLQWLKADEVSNWQAVRGVASCLQVVIAGAAPVASSKPCEASINGLSWRGVAALRHQNP